MGILLGFEIPTGARVEVPVEGHYAVFGQTQLSGKTTAIEGLVYRADFRAVAFITKRGEGSFLTARVIPPFFSEPTNDPEQPLWRWVTSILEASQKRRLRFEESWIIRACEEPRHAKTLADVHSNINSLLAGEKSSTTKRGKVKWSLKPVTGINAGVYTSLKAYFDIVMPQLARLPYTTKLKLEPGLSVMDLREYSVEMQALVIRAVMEHVYLHERNVRVIVPEAWQFVPEHKGNPVKMACENLVRMGAADKNFLWLDSQDMAAVDKTMLRACSVVLCGVQRELHEIDRTMGSLFGADGISARDVASLKIGQFFLALPGGEVRKVYTQPAWMDSELHAAAIARGEETIGSAKPMLKAFERERESEAHDALAERVRQLESQGISAAASPAQRQDTAATGAAGGNGTAATSSQQARANADGGSAAVPAIFHPAHLNGHDLDNIYEYIRDRAAKDPGVLELLLNRPELQIHVIRQKISTNGDTLRGQLALLISKKFFDKPQNGNAAFNELKRLGFPCAKPNVYRELDKLAQLGFVTKEDSGYQAVVGMHVHIEEA